MLAVLGIVDFLSDQADDLSLHGESLIKRIKYELNHAFLPEDMKVRMVGWLTILLSFIVGPIMASRIHGGSLKEGEKANLFVGWLVKLSGKFGKQDVSWLSESQLAEALDKRLYFDDLYEGILARTVIESLKKYNQRSMQSSFKLWPDFDALFQKEVKIIEENDILEGKNIGIDHTGALLLDDNGVINKVYNGHLVI